MANSNKKKKEVKKENLSHTKIKSVIGSSPGFIMTHLQITGYTFSFVLSANYSQISQWGEVGNWYANGIREWLETLPSSREFSTWSPKVCLKATKGLDWFSTEVALFLSLTSSNVSLGKKISDFCAGEETTGRNLPLRLQLVMLWGENKLKGPMCCTVSRGKQNKTNFN